MNAIDITLKVRRILDFVKSASPIKYHLSRLKGVEVKDTIIFGLDGVRLHGVQKPKELSGLKGIFDFMFTSGGRQVLVAEELTREYIDISGTFPKKEAVIDIAIDPALLGDSLVKMAKCGVSTAKLYIYEKTAPIEISGNDQNGVWFYVLMMPKHGGDKDNFIWRPIEGEISHEQVEN